MEGLFSRGGHGLSFEILPLLIAAAKKRAAASSYSGQGTGLFGGGSTTTYSATVEQLAIVTLGNSVAFGNLTVARECLAATSNGANGRGIFGGGAATDGASLPKSAVIDYVNITSAGDATNFGNLTVARRQLAAASNGTNDRGLFLGGEKSTTAYQSNVIDRVTISTTGNAVDFGDLYIGQYYLTAVSNATLDRAVSGLGLTSGGYYSVLYYTTISTPGNAVSFGNTTENRLGAGGTSNGVNDRGVFCGGGGSFNSYKNTIDYITISTTGNAVDFGDLTVGRAYIAATSNGTGERGVIGGGNSSETVVSNTIDYITINTSGNATDFGDMAQDRKKYAATSNA
jgi:hypothetical protein